MNITVCFVLTICSLLIHTGNNVADAEEKVDIFKYFEEGIPDLKNNLGLLKWSKVVTSNEELAETLKGESNMIKANVVHDNEKVACIEPADETEESDLSLSAFLQEFKRLVKNKTKGLMMHLKTQEGFDSAMTVLQNEHLSSPVWLHINIGQGPGGDEFTVDLKYSKNSNILNAYTTSIGLTTGLDINSLYTEEMFKNMTTVMEGHNDFYAIRGVFLKKSWETINGKSLELKPLVIWAEEEDQEHIHILSLRNLLYKHRRFYFKDLPLNLEEKINSVCKNYDIFDFFKGRIEGFEELKFHKNVRSLQELKDALQKEEYHVIKATVSAENGEAFIEDKNFKLQDLFNTMSGIQKAVKLHISSTEAFETILDNHKEIFELSNFPIWLEANVIQGPNGTQAPVNLNIENNIDFLSCYPLSLGLTSTSEYPDRSYTREMMEELKALNEPDGPFIVYSLRAIYVHKSERIIDSILINKNDLLYFWAEEDEERIVSYELRSMRNYYEGFYFWDLPEETNYRLEKCPKNRNELIYFVLSDNRLLKFTDFVRDENHFKEMLTGELHMIKTRVFLDDNKNAAFVGETTRYSLQKLFEEFKIPEYKKGLVLRFKDTASYKFVVDTFKKELREIEKPIWLYVDVVEGPGGTNTNLIDTDFFLHNDVMDCCTMLYSWSTSNSPQKVYTPEHASKMDNFLKGEGRTVYAVRAEYMSDETLQNLNTLRDIYTFLPTENIDVFISKQLREILIFNKAMYVDVKEHYLWNCANNQDAMKYFELGSLDLKRIVFSKKAIGSEAELDSYLNDDNIHMIKANVKTSEDGIPIVTDSISLGSLLDKVDGHEKKKGLELTFVDNEAVEAAIATSLEQLKKLEFPIWLRVFTAKGPGSLPTQTTTDLNYNYFNDILDCRTSVLAWITDIKEAKSGFTQDHIDDLLNNTIFEQMSASQNIIIEVRGEFLTSSWALISQNFDRKYKFWISDAEDGYQGVIIAKDLRDAALSQLSRIYVDIPENLKKFLVECPNRQDVYIYFWNLNDLRKNASILEFHESVSTLPELEKAILSGKHMINLEVYEKNEEAVVKKVPGEGGEIEVSLGDFLNFFETNEDKVTMGIQLLFKSTEAFTVAIKNHYDQIRNMNRPIWINANILKGPGGDDNVVNFDYNKYNDVIDCRTMVLGWTTSSAGVYTKEQIEEMEQISLGTSQKLYSIRMMNLFNSWNNLEAMKNEKLLLWASDADIENMEVDKLRSLIESNEERLFLDLSDNARKQLYNNNGVCNGGNVFTLVLISLIFITEFDYKVGY